MRIAELDQQISQLKEKRLQLAQSRGRIWFQALRPGDVVNAKNAQKIEILSLVRAVLSKEPRGMTSAAIFEAISKGAPSLKFETLRSYLSRYKNENRLFHDSGSGKWMLMPNIIDNGEAN